MSKRIRKESAYTEDYLKTIRLTDCTPRNIKSREMVEIFCSVCKKNTVQRSMHVIKKSLKNKGYTCVCDECLKTKHIRSEETIKKIKQNAQTKEHKERARKIGNSKRTYTEELVKKISNECKVSIEGDLSNPLNIVTVTWEDGHQRTDRISRLFRGNTVLKKKENKSHLQFLKKIQKLNLSVENINPTSVKITYKGFSWLQKKFNHIGKTFYKKIEKIELGMKIQNLLDSGMTLNNICKEVGVDWNRYYRYIKKGYSPVEISVSSQNHEQLLQIDGAVYNRYYKDSKKRPDILLEDIKLIIEIDGMFSHAELKQFKDMTIGKPKKYHFERWEYFHSQGFKILAFSEREVKDKKDIVISMINHKLGKSQKHYGRKTLIKELSTKEANDFFGRVHLKGKGSGKAIGLFSGDSLLCAIRYINKSENGKSFIFISRFACELNTAVIGGYSKLLNLLPKDIDIVNFVDRRHGNGEHLLKEGFEKVSTHLGFEWTDNYHNYNRQKFPGNSGYELGYRKFYDYGQIKYTRAAKPVS